MRSGPGARHVPTRTGDDLDVPPNTAGQAAPARSMPIAATRVTVAALGALLVFLTSATLTPEARGAFAALQSAGILLASVAGGSLGLGIAVVVGQRPAAARRMARLSWLAALALLALGVAAALALAGPLGLPSSSTVAVAAAGALLAGYGALQGLPIGLGTMASYAGADLVRGAVSLLVPAIALAAGERDPATLLALWAAGPLLASLPLLRGLPAKDDTAQGTTTKEEPVAGGRRPPRATEIRLAVARSLKAHPANVVGLAVTRLDIVLLAVVANAREVAYYSLAVVIAEAAWLLPSALAISATSDFVRSGREHAARVARRAVGRTVGAGAASGVVATVLGVSAILLFLPDAYHRSIAPLAVLLAGTVPYSVGHVVSPLLVTAIDRAGTATAIATVTLLVDLALVLALGGPFGALGAAIASAAAYGVNAALNLAALHSETSS